MTTWNGDGLARALDGATVLISAVPAAAWANADGRRPASRALSRRTAVLEMAYGAPTPLADAARRQTPRYADGLGMLVHQAAHAIKLALGKAPPLPPLFRAARGQVIVDVHVDVHVHGTCPMPAPYQYR